MSSTQQTESRHGVMVCINGKGLLITGEAGIGKSSLALELVNQGHQLIADDVVDICLDRDCLMATSPKMLKGLLHSRELGTIDVTQLFGNEAFQDACNVDYVLELCSQRHSSVSLEANQPPADILQTPIPRLCLSAANPASVVTRLMTWLAMQDKSHAASLILKQRQQQQMQQQ